MGTLKSHHTVISSLFSKQVLKWSKNILVRWAHVLVRAGGSWGEAELNGAALGQVPECSWLKNPAQTPAPHLASQFLDCWMDAALKEGRTAALVGHC